MVEDVLLQAKNAEVRSGPADSGVDLGGRCGEKARLERCQSFWAPSIGSGDTATQVTHAHLFARSPFVEDVRQAIPNPALDRVRERELLGGAEPIQAGDPKKQKNSKKFHLLLGKAVNDDLNRLLVNGGFTLKEPKIEVKWHWGLSDLVLCVCGLVVPFLQGVGIRIKRLMSAQ